MKRTISLEAAAAVSYLRNSGFTPAHSPPSRGGPCPWVALGVGPEARWPEVRQAFLSRLRQYPPERCPEEFVCVVDAYGVLKRHFRDAEITAAANHSFSQAQTDCDTSLPNTKRRRGCEAGSAIPGAMPTQPNPQEVCAGSCSVPTRGVIALDMTGVAHHPYNQHMPVGAPTPQGHNQLHQVHSCPSFGGAGGGPPPPHHSNLHPSQSFSAALMGAC
mmetsp:Transcript_49822/g.106052  ORF Transcript_49822/g.106052 Transcript_49822/m.106052 type:complete len:217 (-) Transcript_49822:52-702(-)